MYYWVYVLFLKTATEIDGIFRLVIKIGTTLYPENRKWASKTYGPNPPIYLHLFKFKAEVFNNNPQKLYDMDNKRFPEFLKNNNLSHVHIKNGGGTEWYIKDGWDYEEILKTFFNTQGVALLEQIDIDPFPMRPPTEYEKNLIEAEDTEILTIKTQANAKSLQTQTVSDYIVRLNCFHQPHQEKIMAFLQNSTTKAALIKAVCGFGKTVITTKSIKNIIDRLIVVVPTDSLKDYWRNDLIHFADFAPADIYNIGGSGISNIEQIATILKKPKYALILCYASTPLLMDVLTTHVQLAVFDEAHRLAGLTELNDKNSDDEEDEDDNNKTKKADIGRTKRLIRKCAEVGVKRLSLTFTPKAFESDEQNEDVVNSNDDVELFGESIVNVSLREMIEAKLLPDYKIMFPHGETTNGNTLKSKVQLYLKEFNTIEDGQYLMNHGIIFGATHGDCNKIVKYLIEETEDDENRPEIIYLDKAVTVKEKLALFEKVPRAIIINCMLAGEGVNIKKADAVNIMCNKRSYSQIIQMLLRAGRYLPTKKRFYIIMTLLDDDENEDIQFALEALTQIDIYLEQQIIKTVFRQKEVKDPNKSDDIIDEDGLNENILTNSAHWNDVPAIRECFTKMLRKRTQCGSQNQQSQLIRKICKKNNIRNSSAYNKFRLTLGWMEEPWLKRNMTAYDYFHEEDEIRLDKEDFRKVLVANNITTTDSYNTWHNQYIRGNCYPSVEDINDGYFGKNNTNLQLFLSNGLNRRR